MDLSIGYACLGIGVPGAVFRTTTMKYASKEKLEELIRSNLHALKHILSYNIHHEIRLFRISSDLIPFGSNPINTLDWTWRFQSEWEELAGMIRQGNLRVSMHPGQYTVLNSPDDGVVERAIADLNYHEKVLSNLGTDFSHKIILHIGGAYGDKESALFRFKRNYTRLPDRVKGRLVLENDDRIYTIEEALKVGQELHIPVVFDNLHHLVNPPLEKMGEMEWMKLAHETWTGKDGCPKIHYSQHHLQKKSGSHSHTIDLKRFKEFYDRIPLPMCDIMLEVKDKNLSAMKCINGTRKNKHIRYLEEEWALYKYSVLERSPGHYQGIRNLLKEKDGYPVEEFYRQIDEALRIEGTMGTLRNGIQHVWGYMKNLVTEEEKEVMAGQIRKWEEGTLSLATLKKRLRILAEKYQQSYLIKSYYFAL
jgi:UV DNA damage endonuclease